MESIPSPWTPSNQGRLEDSLGSPIISTAFDVECRSDGLSRIKTEAIPPPPRTLSNPGRLEDSHGFRGILKNFQVE